MRVTPFVLVQNLSNRMWVGWPKRGSDEGYLAYLMISDLQKDEIIAAQEQLMKK